MKFKKYTFPILILLLFPALLAAQSEQLQREIRIAEGILNELFSENLQDDSPFIGLAGNRITSDYIPGYGVHFMIGDRLIGDNIRFSGRMEVVRTDGYRSVIEISDEGNGESSPEITRESIEEKIDDYLTLYAPLIQSLPENEYIRVSTGLRTQTSRILIALSIGERSYDFPKITKWVSGSDLQQFRADRITEEQFLSRVQSADLSETSEIRDYNIFSSILGSSVKDADFEYLRVRILGVYSYLPGLGVQFNLNASSPGSQLLPFFNTLDQKPNVDLDIKSIESSGEFSVSSEELDSMVKEIKSRRQDIDSIRVSAEQSIDSLRVALKGLSVSISDLFTGDRERPEPEDLDREKNLLYEEIKRTIKEYGTTLSSLPNDEMLIISINWTDRNANLPERTYLRIRKSDIMSSSEPVIQEIPRR